MRFSELNYKVDNLILSKEDVSNYKNYIEGKVQSLNGNFDINSVEDPFLDKIYSISKGFSCCMGLNEFKKLILDELKSKSDNLDFNCISGCNTFFSVIFKVNDFNDNLVERLYDLYNISFEGKYCFYLIDESLDIDFLDEYLVKNVNDFKDRILKNFGIKNGILIPYSHRNHYYYLLHYNESRNNSFMEGYFLSNTKIDTKKSCIFFFWENEKTKQKYIVVRQSGKASLNNAIITAFKKTFNKRIDFYKYPIGNLSSIDGSETINKPTNWNMNINKIELYSIGYNSIIAFSGDSIMKDISNFTDKGNKVNLISADIQFECINDTTRKDIGNYISGIVSRDSIEYITKNQHLGYFLSLLESSDLIQTKAVGQFNTKDKIIYDCLYKGECFIKSELDEISLLKEYVGEITYISDGKVESLRKDEIDFKNMSFSEASQFKGSIIGLLKIKLKFEDLFKKIIDVCVSFTTANDSKFSTISFSRTRNEDLKNTVLIFAEKFEDIMTFMKQGKKYLLFLENSNINEELVKYFISNKIIFKPFGKESLSELLAKGKTFIEENVANCKYIENNDMNVLEISESGDGDGFEDIISYILKNFIHNHISLGNQERGISLPDGIIFEGDKNIFYDAKSSQDIVGYLKSPELRKIKSYMELFPEGKGDNIFICFGPKIDTKGLNKVEERVEMKEILNKGQKIIYVGADCLDLLYKIIKCDGFDDVKGFIKSDWLTGVFSGGVRIGSFAQLDISILRDKFKYAFENTKPEILEKIEERSKGKVDLVGTMKNIEQYASNLII